MSGMVAMALVPLKVRALPNLPAVAPAQVVFAEGAVVAGAGLVGDGGAGAGVEAVGGDEAGDGWVR